MTRYETENDPERLESEIAETRSAISDRLNAIGEKLNPDRIKQRARGLFDDAKETAVDKLREAKNDAFESVHEAVHEAGDRARNNAIPLGLIGLGFGLLLMGSGRRRRVLDYGARWEREGRPRVRRQLVRAEESALDFARANPLAIGAGALAAGVAAGLLLPSTRREDEVLGRTRDHLLGEVRGGVAGVQSALREGRR